MGFWKQPNKNNAQNEGDTHGLFTSSEINPFEHSPEVHSRFDELLLRYNKAADDFKNTVSAAKDLCRDDPAEIGYLESVFEKYNTTNTLVQGYGDKLQGITDLMEQTVLFKSFENSITALETYKKDVQNAMREHASVKKREGFSLFAGCDTVEKLKQRYKELSKNYHPDTQSGDKDAMQEINSEYERLLKAFEVLKP